MSHFKAKMGPSARLLDSFTTLALYKYIYLLTYLLTVQINSAALSEKFTRGLP